MQGRSGATVQVGPTTAQKRASDPVVQSRLFAQGNWIANHRAAWNVRYRETLTDGYVMERLYEWETPPGEFVKTAHHLWAHPAEVKLDVAAHCEYVHNKLLVPGWSFNRFREEVMDKLRYVMHREERLTRCLTHGDLTRSNVMSEVTRKYGITIDPIPATTAVADVKAFDMSTMVISLLGLEHVQYGWPQPSSHEMLHLSGLLWELNHVELECVRYMSVVQIARRLPYHPEEMHADLREIARQALCIRP